MERHIVTDQEKRAFFMMESLFDTEETLREVAKYLGIKEEDYTVTSVLLGGKRGYLAVKTCLPPPQGRIIKRR